MPKIPDYDSQLSGPSGGVQPGNLFLPNIHVGSGAPQVWGQIAEAADKFGAEYATMERKHKREQHVLELSTSMAAAYEGQAELHKKYMGDNSPDVPEKLKKDMTDLTSVILEKVSPEFRPMIGANLARTLSHGYATISYEHARRMQQFNQQQMVENADTIATAVAQSIASGNKVMEQAARGNLYGLIDSGEETGQFPWKKGDGRVWADKLVKGKVLGILMAERPTQVLEAIKTPEGRAALGVVDEKYDDVLRGASAAVNREQSQVYQDVLGGLAKGVAPTEAQLMALDGGQRFQLQNIQKSLGAETDQDALVDLHIKVNELPLDEDVVKNGKALMQEVVSAPGISAAHKVQLHNFLQKKIDKAQSNADQFEENLLKDLGQHMDTTNKKLMNMAYFYGPDGKAKLPAGASLPDKAKFIREFALPHIQRSQQALLDKAAGKSGKKTTGLTFEEAEKGVGKGEIKPSGKVSSSSWWKVWE